jgi:hypothetical protein
MLAETIQGINKIKGGRKSMSTKRLLNITLALALLFTVLLSASASAAYYQQHQSNPAMIETLEEAHANAPVYLANEYGRIYVPDPALDMYPQGTTYVYRSAGIFSATTGANRMNTNILVYADQSFEDKDAALAYLQDLGLTAIADEATGSVVLVTPIDPENGFGDADQYAFYQLQSAMCNIGFAIRGTDSTTYYADAAYFGGLTYRYLIGFDGGATFLNDYISSEIDYISRIAGMLLVGGNMEKIRTVASPVPAWLVNPSEDIVAKYAAGNETDSKGRNGNDEVYYNQEHPLQQVIVTKTEKVDLASFVHNAYYDLFIKAFRIPVVKAGLNTASTDYRNYRWNQAPYSLGERSAIINGVTPDGIHVFERQGETFSDYKASNGEYITTWYEFLPTEVFDGTAPEHSIPLILVNHGGGDDPVQCVDELGFLTLAGKERVAMVAERHASEDPGSNFMSASPYETMSDVLPVLVRYMLETYPQLDPERVYVTGYSMGGGATNRAVYGDASVFAAAVNMSGTPYTHLDGQELQFADVDIPMMLTTCTYDTFTHFDSANGYIAPDFQMNINDYLGYNEMPTVEFDFETYPLSGFKGDVYRETMINDEYPLYTWFFLNDEGAPMVGLNVIEFIPHGLYQEYAKLAWDYFRQFSRDQDTGEIVYHSYAN